MASSNMSKSGEPALNTPFCYYVETPKFINFDIYQSSYLVNYSSKCTHHEELNDHSLNTYNTCTDYRAWSLDDGQRRKHFFDIISRHIPQCGEENHSENENKLRDVEIIQPKIKGKPVKNILKDQEKLEYGLALSEKYVAEKELGQSPPEHDTNDTSLKPRGPERIADPFLNEDVFTKPNLFQDTNDILSPISPINDNLPHFSFSDSENSKLPDDLVEQLDSNLSNLETTFDKFVCKNRDFIQNLIECLNFEKKRQEELKNNHCNIKQENDILQTKNEYLKMVNGKQVEYFKNELEKALNENKAGHLKQVQHLERVISCNKEELQYYKQNEIKLLKTVENNRIELHKLKNDISNLKSKETKLVKEYIKVLNFLEDVQKTIKQGENDGCRRQRSSITICDSETVSNLDDVLRNALYNGIESLNVRDLSILHDSIEELNERLCHQNEYCGKSPALELNLSQPQFYRDSGESLSSDYNHKEVQDYESNLSMVPSRQGPERPRVQFCPNEF